MAAAHFEEYRAMTSQAKKAGPAVRTCKICGANLGPHNKNDVCLPHPPEETPESYRAKLEAMPRTPEVLRKLARLPSAKEKTGIPGTVVAKLVADHFGMSLRDLWRRNRDPHTTDIRKLAAYLLYTDCKLIHAKLGAEGLGGMTHSKASKNVAEIEDLLAKEKDMKEEERSLSKTIARIRAKYSKT